MIIAVSGWRDYADATFIRKELMVFSSLRACSMRGPLHVRVGDAMGADAITRRWCEEAGVSHQVFRADWNLYGKQAGPIRNNWMLMGIGDTGSPNIPADLLLAFPRTDGQRDTVPGSGTWGCCIEAAVLGIEVRIPPHTPRGVS